MARYFIDPDGGDDVGDGTKEVSAWKTLDRLNGTRLGPGDRILLKSGTSVSGRLAPSGGGTADAPICIQPFGEGARPRIDGEGRHPETVLLRNVEHVELRDLEITNHGPEPEKGRSGVRVEALDYGTVHGVRLSGLHIHDVNGENVAMKGGEGVTWENRGARVPSRFDGLAIENCHIAHLDCAGIRGYSDFWERDRWYPSLNVVIRNNTIEDVGGDGIVPIGTDGCLIEHNRVDRARQRTSEAACGIWVWSCDNSVIQFNEVSRMRGDYDGQGFDSDDNCVNTLFQYNYSHDNEGGFILVCSCGDVEENSAWLRNTVVRYNVSQNDGARLFHVGGPVRDLFAYNNTFFVGEGRDVHAVFQTEDAGWPSRTYYWNNIFCVEGSVDYQFGESTQYVFDHNTYFGDHENRPHDDGAVTADPALCGPGHGGAGRNSLAGYRLRRASPCNGAARPVVDNGGRDFWGAPVRPDGPHCIGAHEFAPDE